VRLSWAEFYPVQLGNLKDDVLSCVYHQHMASNILYTELSKCSKVFFFKSQNLTELLHMDRVCVSLFRDEATLVSKLPDESSFSSWVSHATEVQAEHLTDTLLSQGSAGIRLIQ
jgi:arginine deiminase